MRKCFKRLKEGVDLNIQNALDLFDEYTSADVFKQNELAVEFMEKYAGVLLHHVLNCQCDLNKKEEVKELFKKIEDDLLQTLRNNQNEYFFRKEVKL